MGQHYNQAAYIGKYFSYLPQKPENINNYRKYDLEVLKFSDLFKLKDPTLEEISSLIKTKPAEKIFDSGQIINLKSEDKFNVGTIEQKVFKLLDEDLLFISNKADKKFIDYFALHEARSIISYHLLRRLLYNGIFEKNKKTVRALANEIDFLKVLSKNKNIITREINSEIKKTILKGKFDYVFFEEFARLVFNYTYPLIWNKNKHIYLNQRRWVTIKVEAGYSINFGTTPILNFTNHLFGNIGDFAIFKSLPVEIQIILKNSLIVIEKKNSFSIGVDVSNPNTKKVFDNFINNDDTPQKLTTIASFLFVFSFFTSHDFFIFSSAAHKNSALVKITKHFNDLKNHYHQNLILTTLNGKFNYGKTKLSDFS